MRKRGILAGTLAAVALAAAGAPGEAASPSPQRVVLGGSLKSSFSLRAANGYEFTVEATAPRTVEVSFSKGGAFTDYRVKGTVSASAIRARFGRFGRIAVAFRPTRKTPGIPPFPGCRGKREDVSIGVFEGVIRFRGGGGFSRVGASRARGSVARSSRQVCGGRGSKGRGAEEEPKETERPPVLLVAACGETRFEIFREDSEGEEKGFLKGRATLALASDSEARGRVAISRFAIAFARRRAFAFDEALASASVRLGRPFAGTATFSRGADGSRSWAGPLSVAFPDRRVALAGPRFATALRRVESKADEAVPRSDHPACRD